MEHMVINPYWYVPRSIINGEYLPAIRSNPYAVGHLEITDYRGRIVDRVTAAPMRPPATFPFNMRQPPGPGNALGTVKFMFPNEQPSTCMTRPRSTCFRARCEPSATAASA